MDARLSLFGADDPAAVLPAMVPPEVIEAARRLPPAIRLGTSSWSFPGWEGLVYKGARDTAQLARDGLHAYAQHPLLRTVGVDRAWYAPVDVPTWRSYAQAVPDDFRFLVKGPAAALQPHLAHGAQNPSFLDADWTVQHALAPLIEGLGPKAGPVVLQFSPMSPAEHGDPETFAHRLGSFLRALAAHPGCPPLAVEVRNRRLLTQAYAEALRSAGAVHVLNVFPGMPAIATQARVDAAVGGSVCVVRWMLHPDHTYQGAKRTFAPFHTMAAPLPAARDDIAQVLAAASHAGRPAWVIANNKAEGSAPLTLVALALRLVALLDG